MTDSTATSAQQSGHTPATMKRRALIFFLAAGLLAVLGGGAAFAYVSGGRGAGTGNATVASAQTVTASGASLSGTLYPGATVNLIVSVKNPYANLGMTITGLTSGGSITGGGPGCAVSNVSLITTASFNPTTVSANSSRAITFSGAVQMSSGAPNACQGQTFTVPIAVTTKVG